MLRLNPLALLGSSSRLLRPTGGSLPARFSSSAGSTSASASAPPTPPLSDGEQKLKSKLEAHFDGAVVEVADVSGAWSSRGVPGGGRARVWADIAGFCRRMRLILFDRDYSP